MTTTGLLAPFQWLNVSENAGGGPLGVIYSVAFLRGLDPAEVVRRFSRGEDSGQESDFGGLNDKAYEFINKTGGGNGGGYVGVFDPASDRWPSSPTAGWPPTTRW
ncbi:hypothetical protein [Nonomuraea terrae]|uniref:hypothetical protein n=1 Tax=Nonomuraea terrae TaxID=2530383 RepID=UPI001CB754A8|nr:hypothetical protein [Nonomuraea terrae]